MTPIKNLNDILDSNMLYSNLDRLYNEIYPNSGHGYATQNYHNLCEGCTNFSINNELIGKCTQSIGITFGILCYGNEENSRFKKDDYHSLNKCCLYFSVDILKNKYYHINLEDNFGFFIYNGIDAFGRKNDINECKSFTDETILEMTPKIYDTAHDNGIELLYRESVSLDYLTHIKFYSNDQLNKYKNKLDKLGITYSIL